jgi:hypothetical protein
VLCSLCSTGFLNRKVGISKKSLFFLENTAAEVRSGKRFPCLRRHSPIGDSSLPVQLHKQKQNSFRPLWWVFKMMVSRSGIGSFEKASYDPGFKTEGFRNTPGVTSLPLFYTGPLFQLLPFLRWPGESTPRLGILFPGLKQKPSSISTR